MNGSKKDEELIRLAQLGQHDAFGQLASKYQPRILNAISRYNHSIEDAEDLTQETLIKAYRGLPGFHAKSSFYTWLYRIAMNVSKDQRHLNINFDSSDEALLALHSTDTASPESNLHCEQFAKQFQALLNELPKELSKTFILREFEGKTYQEIADVFDCPIGTVRSRLHTVRKHFDDWLHQLS